MARMILKSIVIATMVVCAPMGVNAAENENEFAFEQAQVINPNEMSAAPGDTVLVTTADLPAGISLLQAREYCSRFFNANPNKVLREDGRIAVQRDTVIAGHNVTAGDTLLYTATVSLRGGVMVPKLAVTKVVRRTVYVDQQLPNFAANYRDATPATRVVHRQHTNVNAGNRQYELRDYSSLSQAEREAIATGKLHAYDPWQQSATGRPQTNFYVGLAAGGAYMVPSHFLAPEGDILVGYEVNRFFGEGQLALTRAEFPDSAEVSGNYTAVAARLALGFKVWQSTDFRSNVALLAFAGGQYQKSDDNEASYKSRNFGATFGGGLRASFAVSKSINVGAEAGYTVQPWVNHGCGSQDWSYGGPYARLLMTFSLGAH